jgi:hypothetical protein
MTEESASLAQRVLRIESAREAEEPHVATKADISRLATRIAEAQAVLQAEIGETRSDLQEQIAGTRSDLQGQIADLKIGVGNSKLSLEKQLRQFLMWMSGTAIALAAVIIAAFAIIVAQLL